MTKPNILITGATGFIGQAFLKKLDKKSFNVYVLARELPPAFAMEGIAGFFEHDLREPFKSEVAFDFVFHLAACNFTNVDERSKEQYRLVNVQGTRHLLSAVKTKKFILMSTAKVYKTEGQKLIEQSHLHPAALYERSKLEAEVVCFQKIDPKHLVILRATNIVGPGQADKALVPVFFRNALSDKPISITVPPDTVLQLLSVDDVADAFLKIINHPEVSGVFNLAPQETITVEQVAQEVVRLVQLPATIECKVPSSAAAPSLVDSTKAQALLGWTACTGTRELLSQCYTYYKKVYGSQI